MTMIMDENIIGVWYSMLPGGDADWLGSMCVTKDDKIEITYRFRYYVDDKSFDSKDKRNWYSAKANNTEDAKTSGIKTLRKMCALIAEMADYEPYELLMDDEGFDKFIERFKKAPFTHMKEEAVH